MQRHRGLNVPKHKYPPTCLFTFGYMISQIKPSWLTQARLRYSSVRSHSTLCFLIMIYQMFILSLSWRQRMSCSIVSVKLMAGSWDLKEIEWRDFLRIMGKTKQSPRDVRHSGTSNTRKIIECTCKPEEPREESVVVGSLWRLEWWGRGH